ncbi:MAG TPA: ABC transporter substrate-binding protein [Clostridia bacterium]|nr:ABC transporter substrate-binding protein [Clostridia bacterium]
MIKSKHRILVLLLVLGLVMSIVGCSSSSTPANEPKPQEQTEQAAPAQNEEKPVIALSNSYYGNIWRKQMVDTFETAAKEAKDQGLIKDYMVLNGDGTQQQQMTQLNDLILKGVDVIAIDSASPTALNGTIAKAQEAGIKVLSFDSIATEENHYKLNFDFIKYGEDVAQYVVDHFNGKADVLIIRGVAGSAPDADMYKGMMNVLEKNSGMNIVGTVYGQATTAVANKEVSSILPSLKNVDAVICQGGGDSYGVVQAFQQANREMPLITGDGSAEFTKWWYEENQKGGYETLGLASTPGVGGAAFWVSLAIAEGKDVPKDMLMPHARINQEELDKYKDMEPNSIVSPVFTKEWVEENIISKK